MSPVDADGRVVVAIPKGTLEPVCLEMLSAGGLEVGFPGRMLQCRPSSVPLTFVRLKARDIVSLLTSGACALGFAGFDQVRDAELGGVTAEGTLTSVFDTRSSKSFGRPIRWVVAAPANTSLSSLAGLRAAASIGSLRVATELVHVAEDWCGVHLDTAAIVRTTGASEAFPPLFADVIIDIVDSGESLRVHGLVTVAEVLTSTARLWAHQRSLEDDARVGEAAEWLVACLDRGAATLGI